MKEILGALLVANIIGFGIIAYVLHDHNDEYHNQRRNINVEVERDRPYRDVNVEVFGRSYYRSPHYQRNENWQRSPHCPSHFRHERHDIYIDVNSRQHYQYIGSNTYINLNTGRRYCP